eukprot:scaffold443_cov125-Cylindrotheca_fusiformis.AAC.24
MPRDCTGNNQRIWWLVILQSIFILHLSYGFLTSPEHARRAAIQRPSSFCLSATDANLELGSLMDMDVVIYSSKRDNEETKFLGALQEDGSLAPLSTWTTEPAFGESIEFLVDEEDRFSLNESEIQLHYLIDQSELSYGSRQCHRGVGNPHGEESELLYYVDQDVIEKFDVKVVVKPELEILW